MPSLEAIICDPDRDRGNPPLRSRHGLSRALLVVVGLLSSTGAASQELYRTPIAETADGTAALGIAAHAGTNNYIGESTSYDQVPLLLYEGRRVFAHGNTLGFRLVKNDWFTFGPLARARLGATEIDKVPELSGLDLRKDALEAGLTTALTTRFGELHLTTTRDVSNRHEGEELDISYRLPLSFRRLTVTPWVSHRRRDENLANYYYGVGESEIAPGRPAYTPGKVNNLAWGLNTSYSFGDHLYVFANVGVERLDDAAAASPIIDSSKHTRGLVGAFWAFGGDPPPPSVRGQAYDGPPLWSWRVHLAYQFKHNIFPLGMSGIITPSNVTKGELPTQAGLTLSRLLRTGKRADIFARAGWIRHFEEPFQENFDSYTLSLASVLKTYDNFTDKVKFRWGFGFGLSYAESIPAQEVQLFVNRYVDHSHLLVYMEMTFDFALDRFIKSERVKGCYVGAILTHRSGAFGNSEILGGVNGGSDWGGIHLECRR